MADKKRKPLSKKLRFEVFKRDNFTCQYCGRSSPAVVLEVDHIVPVYEGGKNEILNLVTSCVDCNRGKGKTVLTDGTILEKQKEQLEELNQRREQIKLMLKWKEELEKLDDEMCDKIDQVLCCTGSSFSLNGRIKLKNYIQKYGFEEVYESAKISLMQYFVEGQTETIDKTFNMVYRICDNRRKQAEIPYYSKFNYIKAIVKNKIGDGKRNYILFTDIENILKEIQDDEEMEQFINGFKTCKTFTEFQNHICDWG